MPFETPYSNCINFLTSIIIYDFSEFSENAKMVIAVGQEMANADMHNLPQPVVVSINPDDDDKMKALKSLVNDMTRFHYKQRIAIELVEKTLHSLLSDKGKWLKDYEKNLIDIIVAVILGHSYLICWFTDFFH